MDSTVAVRTNGFGSLFHAVKNASMDACRSSTLRKTPLRIAFRSNWPNQCSTKFSQPELVGTKWITKPGVTLQPGPDIPVLVSAIVVRDEMERNFTTEFRVQGA